MFKQIFIKEIMILNYQKNFLEFILLLEQIR